MIVKTQNTTYTIEVNPVGITTICGHAKYCPTPQETDLIVPPVVGHSMVFTTPAARTGMAQTSRIKEIIP
jgi:hypothetical protein